jgi:outer membrane protein assembly complex protein YaeT
MKHRVLTIALLLMLSIGLSGLALAEETQEEKKSIANIPLVKTKLTADIEDAEGASVDQGDAFWGKTVRKIIYTVPPYISMKDIKKATKLKANRTLSRWRVRQTIRRIYLLGTVENTVIRAIPIDAENVDVEVKIYPIYLIRDIKVEDNRTFNYAEVTEDILHISSGDDFVPDHVRKWETKIRHALAREGKLNGKARVLYERTKRHIDNQVDVVINLDENKTFKVRRISLQGDLGPFSRSKILGELKWRTGMAYNEEKMVKGVARLKKFFKKEKYLEAQVDSWDLDDPRIAKIDKKNNSIEITLRLEVGPKVLIHFADECFTCTEKKWKLPATLDLANQRRFNSWIVKDWEKRIETYFQARGYFKASAMGTYEATFDEDGPVKLIDLEMNPGEKVKIKEIDFKNNPSFKDAELLDQLTGGTYFVEAEIDKDLENVVNFYNGKGFLKAKIIEKRLQYVPDDGIYIQVVLSEGPQAILTEIGMKGFEVFSEERKEEIKGEAFVELKIGEPLNPFTVPNAKAQLIAEYFERGFIKARVKDTVTLSKDGKTAQVKFEIREGEKYFFGDVYIRGNKLTKRHVIRRELFITEDETFSYEDVFASEQALVRLGFFKNVEIRPVDHDIPDTVVDMLVEVSERNSGYIETGFGYNSYFGYSAAFEVGHKNLAGHGRRLSYHVDAAMKDEHFRFDNRHMVIEFTWPWVARLPMDGKVTLFDNQENEIGYDLRTFGSKVGLSMELPKLLYFMKATRGNKKFRRLWDFYSTSLEYEFARDFIFNIDPDVDEEQGEIQITTLTPTISRVERDNPFSPTRGVRATAGSYNSIKLNWSTPALQSQVHYLQEIARTSWYYGLFPITDWGKLVFAQNLVVGHGQALRETDKIPISRRFYLGGSTTIRGFGQNEISPLADDGSTPIGGNFYVQSNTELRVPLPSSLGVLMFFDAGDVTADYSSFYIDRMRATSGLGFRYVTPVGPISADYGIKLNRRPDETIGEFYITIGNAF